jgi:hypothetical protein
MPGGGRGVRGAHSINPDSGWLKAAAALGQAPSLLSSGSCWTSKDLGLSLLHVGPKVQHAADARATFTTCLLSTTVLLYSAVKNLVLLAVFLQRQHLQIFCSGQRNLPFNVLLNKLIDGGNSERATAALLDCSPWTLHCIAEQVGRWWQLRTGNCCSTGQCSCFVALEGVVRAASLDWPKLCKLC